MGGAPRRISPLERAPTPEPRVESLVWPHSCVLGPRSQEATKSGLESQSTLGHVCGVGGPADTGALLPARKPVCGKSEGKHGIISGQAPRRCAVLRVVLTAYDPPRAYRCAHGITYEYVASTSGNGRRRRPEFDRETGTQACKLPAAA